MDNIQAIVSGLSDAQRRLLLNDTFDDGEGGQIIFFDANKSAAYALNRKRLADDFFHLTPLGLQVRKALSNPVTRGQ